MDNFNRYTSGEKKELMDLINSKIYSIERYFLDNGFEINISISNDFNKFISLRIDNDFKGTDLKDSLNILLDTHIKQNITDYIGTQISTEFNGKALFFDFDVDGEDKVKFDVEKRDIGDQIVSPDIINDAIKYRRNIFNRILKAVPFGERLASLFKFKK